MTTSTEEQASATRRSTSTTRKRQPDGASPATRRAPPDGRARHEEAGEGLGLLVDRRKVWKGHWLAGNIPGWTAQSLAARCIQSRYLSDEGRLFFNSPDDLVPESATNQARRTERQGPTGENVYEYEPDGVGSCESRHRRMRLADLVGELRPGIGVPGSHPSGNDVFFLTAAQLLPQDTDTAI